MSVGKQIRTKINSVKSTQKITDAMEKVAASKMRSAQKLMAKTKPYSEKILQVVAHVAKKAVVSISTPIWWDVARSSV